MAMKNRPVVAGIGELMWDVFGIELKSVILNLNIP